MSRPTAPEAPIYCRAAINYIGGQGPHPVEINLHNARAGGPWSWKTNGFELIEAPTQTTDWTDPHQLEAVFLPEVEAIARAQTGARHVLFYPPLVRAPENAALEPDLAPVQLAHSDYTESYRPMLEDERHPYIRLLEPSMRRAGVSVADIKNAKRLVTLQLWRNIGGSMDYPLALCDSRTVARSDLQPIPVPEYAGATTQFESFALRAPKRPDEHHWYTFGQMAADEVLLFRAFDSDRMASKEAFWTPHTAFQDVTITNPDTRRSVEARAICLIG